MRTYNATARQDHEEGANRATMEWRQNDNDDDDDDDDDGLERSLLFVLRELILVFIFWVTSSQSNNCIV